MKAILVIDMPECCYDCDFCRFNGGYVPGYYGRNCLLTGKDVQNNNFDIIKSRHETCPLKPMPTRKVALFDPNHCDMEKEIKIIDEINGYNRCIDEILGETK